MNRQQRTAITHHVRFGFQVIHPMFRRSRGDHSEVLTVNSGYE